MEMRQLLLRMTVTVTARAASATTMSAIMPASEVSGVLEDSAAEEAGVEETGASVDYAADESVSDGSASDVPVEVSAVLGSSTVQVAVPFLTTPSTVRSMPPPS